MSYDRYYQDFLESSLMAFRPESCEITDIVSFIHRPWDCSDLFNKQFRIYRVGNIRRKGFGHGLTFFEDDLNEKIEKDTHEFSDNQLFCGYIGKEKSVGLSYYPAKLDDNTIRIEELAQHQGKSFLCSHFWPTVYHRTYSIRYNPCLYSIPTDANADFYRKKLLQAQYFYLSHVIENPYFLLDKQVEFSSNEASLIQITSKHYKTKISNRINKIKQLLSSLNETVNIYRV